MRLRVKELANTFSVSKSQVFRILKRKREYLDSYEMRNIYNMDETGIFFRALPDKTLHVRGTDCPGGKRAKDRLTVALCVNAELENLKHLW